ncbi:MAG: Gfo/Idh/MocA family oxidoreductase [Bryobacteraceae bacterium]
MHRREFLSLSSHIATIGAAPYIVPSHAWGANDRPSYGVIGTGGRGRYVGGLFQRNGAECVAICDVYEPNLELARQVAPNAKTYLDYEELLAHKGLDCVLIATPEHQHCPMLLAALKAGKDVYLEKPISHSLEESRRMVAAVRKTKSIVQVGMQRRNEKSYADIKKFVEDGALGRISLVKLEWNRVSLGPPDNSPLPGKLDWKRFLGPARPRPMEPMRFRRWRYFWDYSGGPMTDMGAHMVDIVQWICHSGPPQSAVCYGRVAMMKGAETPDIFSSVFEYPNFILTWTLNYCNSYRGDQPLMEFQGDKGTLVVSDRKQQMYREPWMAKENREPIYSAPHADGNVNAHVVNFLDCVRSRREPACPIEVGADGVAGTHLANIAFHKGTRATMPGRVTDARSTRS